MSSSDSAQNNDASDSTVIWAGKHNDFLAAYEKQISEANTARLAREATAHQISNKPSLPKLDLTNNKSKSEHSPGNGNGDGREHAGKPKPNSNANPSDKSKDSTKMTKFDRELFTAINDWRVNHGLRELKFNSRLRDMALANNNAMKSRHQVGHFAYGGYEVAGMGYRTPQATLRGWLNSPAHRAILANRNISQMGASGDGMWETAKFT